eukprot:365233-Chlamydomonas_euryale.AAC.7
MADDYHHEHILRMIDGPGTAHGCESLLVASWGHGPGAFHGGRLLRLLRLVCRWRGQCCMQGAPHSRPASCRQHDRAAPQPFMAQRWLSVATDVTQE